MSKEVPREDTPSTSIKELRQYIDDNKIVGFVIDEYSIGELEFGDMDDEPLGAEVSIRKGSASESIVVSENDQRSDISWYVDEECSEIELTVIYYNVSTDGCYRERFDAEELTLRPLILK